MWGIDLLPLLQAAALRDSEPAEPRFGPPAPQSCWATSSSLAWLASLADRTCPFSAAAAELFLKALDLPTAHYHLPALPASRS